MGMPGLGVLPGDSRMNRLRVIVKIMMLVQNNADYSINAERE
jgi:hypothetical protein